MNTVKKAAAISIQAGVPVLLWGSPGSGKTSFVRNVAQRLGKHIEVVIAALRDPTDFAGLPIRTENGVEFMPPSWARRLAREGGILFLDEISCAPPAVQAALLRVVLERVVGDLPLGENVSIVAAANPVDTAASGWELTAPLANRFMHLEWDAYIDTAEYTAAMVSGVWEDNVPVLPNDWKSLIPQARAKVAAFLNVRPELAHVTKPKEGEIAYPTRRSWEMAAVLVAAAESIDVEEDVIHLLVGGAVGIGAATEFVTWLTNSDLPDPKKVLDDPTILDTVENRGDKAFAIMAAVAATATANMTETMWDKAWKVIEHALSRFDIDLVAIAARAIARARKPGYKIPPVITRFGGLVL
ncbi:MAG: AAA family ATPase [Candidatus Methanosuratincola sp.]